MILGYLGHVVTFLAAAFAVMGDTWNPEARGLARLTRTGRLVVLALVCGLGISLLATYQDHMRRVEAHRVAAEEIQQHWRALVYPFKLVLWDLHGREVGYGQEMLDMLLAADTRERLYDLDIRSQAPHHHGRWLKLFSEATANGRDGLHTASVKYNFILDQDLITAIHEVTTHSYVDALIAAKTYGEPNEFSSEAEIRLYAMPLGNLAAEKFYLAYIENLKRLKAEIDRHL